MISKSAVLKRDWYTLWNKWKDPNLAECAEFYCIPYVKTAQPYGMKEVEAALEILWKMLACSHMGATVLTKG